jgi:zinc protease
MSPLARLRRLAFAFLLAFATLAARAALPDGVTQGPSVEGVTEYRLANGLRILLFPDASKPTATVNVTYEVGSAYENYGETGMAHLLEHLVFKGTPNRGNIQTELGRRGMQYNGSTSFDRTNYFESFTASDESLAWALEMEADRMVNSYIRRSDLDSEMTVVRNEFESGENNPQAVLYGRMLSTAYLWHNYGHETIGARSDIENVDIGRLQAFYRLYYQPDNAVLIVAGKFDPDMALRLIVKSFGAIPKPTRTLPPIYTVEPVQDGERTVTLARVGGSKFLGMMFHTARGTSPDYVPLDVLGDVLTVPPAGRLYKSLVVTRKASAVEAWMSQLRDPATLTFFAQIPDADAIAPARETMFATIASLAKEPVTEAEVARMRSKAATYFDETMANPQRFAVAISESVALGDWRLFFITRDRYRTVTPADVNRVAREYLLRSNVTVGEFIPDAKPARAPVAPPVDVAALVKDYKGDAAAITGEAFDASPANLDQRTERFVLGNGAKVALLPKKTRGEAVRFTLSLHYADVKQAFGKQADGELTAAMLLRGSTRHSRQEIEDALDRLRAKVNINGSSTGATISGQTFRKELPETLALIAEVLKTPAFPADELDTLKREETTELEESRTDPQSVALRAGRRENNPYPKGDPRYAPTLDESLETTRAVSVASLRKFHADFYGAGNAEIAIVGDFDAPAVKTQLGTLFGGWTAPSTYTRVPEPLVPNKAAAAKLEVSDKANAFLIGRTALPLRDTSADYAAMLLANYVFGESPSSRLFERLRQKDGLSYSVGSWLGANSFEENSPLRLYAIFAPENLARVRADFAEELARAASGGFTDAEVQVGKEGLLQERRLARTQDGTVASALANQAYLGRTWAFSAGLDAAIEKLTTAEVNAAFRKYVKAPEFAYAFAGDFAKAAPK